MIKDTYAEKIKSVDVKKDARCKRNASDGCRFLIGKYWFKVILKGMGKVKKQSIKKRNPNHKRSNDYFKLILIEEIKRHIV